MDGGRRREKIRKPPPLRLGKKIRARRKDRGLTLVEVAGRTSLSIGFLSQVERDITTPSLSSLALIASALGARIHDFIKEPAPVALHLHGERPQFFAFDPATLAYERLSTAFPGKGLNAVKMHVPPGYLSEVTSHDGEEFVYVLSGTIRYVLSDKSFDLAAGDSLHFSASQRHQVENWTGQPAEVLTVVTQDLFGERGALNRAKRAKLSLNGSRELNDKRELSK